MSSREEGRMEPDYPNEDDFREAHKVANVTRVALSSEQLWAMASEVKRLRALGPAPRQTGRVYFNTAVRPFFGKDGKTIVHAGVRASNGLFALCNAVAYDRTTTFVSEEALATCEGCVREIEIGRHLAGSPSQST